MVQGKEGRGSYSWERRKEDRLEQAGQGRKTISWSRERKEEEKFKKGNEGRGKVREG
jgi:hypothetical protein